MFVFALKWLQIVIPSPSISPLTATVTKQIQNYTENLNRKVFITKQKNGTP